MLQHWGILACKVWNLWETILRAEALKNKEAFILPISLVLVFQCHPDLYFDQSNDWDWSKAVQPAKLELSARFDTGDPSLLRSWYTLFTSLPCSLTIYFISFFFWLANHYFTNYWTSMYFQTSYGTSYWSLLTPLIISLNGFVYHLYFMILSFPFIPEHQICVYPCLLNISLGFLIVTTSIKMSH